MESDAMVRPLGHMELYSSSRHNLGIYRGIANSCQYVISTERLAGQHVQTIVEEALARLVIRLGSLRVGIAEEGTNNAYFVQVPSMDLQDFIQWRTVAAKNASDYDGQLLLLVKDRLEQLWPDVRSRPPWKLLVVQNTTQPEGRLVLDLVFATHHALCDGKSTAVFHTQLLEELNGSSGPPAELRGHVLHFETPPVLSPSQNDLVQSKISWTYFFKALWHEFGPACLKPAPPAEPWRGKPIFFEPNAMHLHLITINARLVSSLIAACRSHSTTLTALFHVLVLASLSKRLPPDIAPSFGSETAISLLPWAKAPPGIDMDLSKIFTDLNTGMSHVWSDEAVSGIRERLDSKNEKEAGTVEETTLWPLATTWRRDVKKKIASLPDDDIVGMLAWVTDWRRRWIKKIGKPRDNAWAVSNIGSISGGSPGGWHIERAFFTQPALVVGPAFALNVTGVKGGSVTVAVSGQKGVAEPQIINGVVEDLEAWFAEFDKSGRFGIFGTRE